MRNEDIKIIYLMVAQFEITFLTHKRMAYRVIDSRSTLDLAADAKHFLLFHFAVRHILIIFLVHDDASVVAKRPETGKSC